MDARAALAAVEINNAIATTSIMTITPDLLSVVFYILEERVVSL